MKVYIITTHFANNMGALLQCYALAKYLRTEEFTDCEVLNYLPKDDDLSWKIWPKPECFKDILKNFYSLMPHKILTKLRKNRVIRSFISDYLPVTDMTYRRKNLLQNPPAADAYICGSDQIWNFRLFDDLTYYLDFCDRIQTRRISYAASFGKKSLVPEEVEETRRLVNKYQYLSMREISGVDILKKLGRNDGINVLDPTLLLNKKEWLKIASSKYNSKNYVLMYNLNRNKKIDKYVEKLAREKNLDIYYISYNLHECFKKGKMKCNVKVEDFLSLIANASYVVTDSFHATAFSINFNTPFMIIFPEKFSTRLASILEVTGLQDRIVEDYNDIKLADKTINFEHANKVLEDERKKASEYLDKALND